MILTCPNCATQYVVKDGAIPPQGRQVRCASCKHSWHQDPEETDQGPPPEVEPDRAAEAGAEVEPAEAVEPEREGDDGESVAEATLIEPRSGPEAEERAYEAAMASEEPAAEDWPVEEAPIEPAPPASTSEVDDAGPAGTAPSPDWDAPPGLEAQDDEFSPFAAPDEVGPRRRSPLLRVLAIVVLVAALAAAFWFLAPAEWRARVGLGGGGTSPLALVTTHMDRQQLESGNELLTVTGRVINPTDKDQEVPPLQAQLKTKTGEVVYSWTIAPPARRLPPGASASFNSAEVNVPPGGDELTITLGSPKA